MSEKLLELQAIRAKLSQLNFQQQHETSETALIDHKAKMKKIEEGGNLPEEWKAYIDSLKTMPFEDGQSKPLAEAYSRAFIGITNRRDHRNETSVRLIMDYVQFRSEQFDWDTVDTILDIARGHMRDFAVIIVASAEVKIFKGDLEKARKILSKALARGRAQPRELLIRAIKSTEAGQTMLLSLQEKNLQVPWILGKNCNQDTEEFKVPLPTAGFTDSHIEMGTDSANISSDGVSNTDLPSFTHPSSTSKQAALRHYHSTPDVLSSGLKIPWSQVQNSKLKGILGKPMRVRIPVQQHPVYMLSQEKEDDTDFMNSIKPFNPTQASIGRFSSLASSGYQSDLTIHTENLNQGQTPSHSLKEVAHSTEPGLVAQKSPEEYIASKKTPLPCLASTAASNTSGVWIAPILATPSCKGTQNQPAVMQTPTGMLETVTVNGEQYYMLKKVGRGGSAQVYMVLDSNKNTRALKVVDLEGVEPVVVNGFRNEISLLQRLQYCDSVIKMYNFELIEKLNHLYVVLEYGETDLSGFFSTRAKQKKGLEPMLIKFYWTEMLRAVNALHNEGIIHSDLKPTNFMLVAGNLKLIDFGIANALQQDKTSVLKDSRVGTPSYMSPEAIMAACDDGNDDSIYNKENSSKPRPKYKVGVRSDVWSLGCILYNMVYGRTPFQHIRNNLGKLQAITNPSYSISFPAIPDPHLMDVLQKCLTRDVKLRPTTTELLSHPYLTSLDKDNTANNALKDDLSWTPSVCNSMVTNTPGTKPRSSHSLQEILKSCLVQGSPRSVVNKVKDLLQELESGEPQF